MIQPLRGYLVLSKQETETKTTSGIYIGFTEEKNVKGKVLSLGSGKVSSTGTVVPMEVQVGDVVLFNKAMATEVKDVDETYYLVAEEALLCKMV